MEAGWGRWPCRRSGDTTGLTPTVPREKGRQRTARGMGFFTCRDDQVLDALDLR